MPTGDDYSLRTPGPIPFGICICSMKPKPHYLLVTLTEYGVLTEIYITELERFQQNICNGCGMPAGDADSSGHLVPSLWDLHMFYLLRPILFRTCRYFTGLCSSNISRYFFDFALPFSRFRYAFLWPLRWLLVYGQDFIHIFKMYMSICTTSVWNGKIGSFTILPHKLRRFLLQHRPSQIGLQSWCNSTFRWHHCVNFNSIIFTNFLLVQGVVPYDWIRYSLLYPESLFELNTALVITWCIP